jgi:hypothetical protein
VEKLPALSNFVGNQLCKGGKETILQHWNYASFTAVLTWQGIEIKVVVIATLNPVSHKKT